MDKEFVQTGRRWQSTPRDKPVRQWIGDACAELEKLEKAFAPIADWYGGGTEGNRPLAEMLTMAVADLQKDRPEMLKLAGEIKQLKAAIKTIKTGEIEMPEFKEKIELPEITTIDLTDPVNAYQAGWETAILECGEILAKAEMQKGGG